MSFVHPTSLDDQPIASSTLKVYPSVSLGPSNGSRLVRMATKKVFAKPSPGKRSWLLGVRGGGDLVDAWLDGSLPTDYGFDLLGRGKDPAALKWYKEVEIIDGRWAMAAVVGILVGQAWISGVPWAVTSGNLRANNTSSNHLIGCKGRVGSGTSSTKGGLRKEQAEAVALIDVITDVHSTPRLLFHTKHLFLY
ncbi:hypothetical protein L7F22_017213 [Adiantum nelumboides]|nr:hypothetical protein [Adiantum nelumboides]